MSSIKPNMSLVASLSRSLVAGDTDVEQITVRCALTLGKRWRWLRPLAGRYVSKYAGQTPPRLREVARFLLADRGFRRAWAKYFDQLRVVTRFIGVAGMQPVAAAAGWDVPAIDTVAGLADWLGLSLEELEWFCDLKRLGSRLKDGSKLSHYDYRFFAKRSGGVRLIECPKSRLKQIQRRILKSILDKVPIHKAVHGFVRGRSIKTFASPHVGQRVVLRMDLQDFFPSIRRTRVQTIFRMMGYPEAVADLLGGLCTNAVPSNVWKRARGEFQAAKLNQLRDAYRESHLPQGAATSPALANICAYHADCRLAGLAAAAGATYTRYADDLAFSGGEEFLRSIGRFQIHAAAMLLEEGFEVNHRKTQVMRQGVRQYLTGLVVNQHLGTKRDDFDRIKAILTNCIRHGAESQNRDGLRSFQAHLEGRVAFVESIHSKKGAKLRKLLSRIRWGDSQADILPSRDA